MSVGCGKNGPNLSALRLLQGDSGAVCGHYDVAFDIAQCGWKVFREYARFRRKYECSFDHVR